MDPSLRTHRLADTAEAGKKLGEFRTLVGSERLYYAEGMATSVASELAEIRETFRLSKSELADLLHRRPQSIIEWEVRGIPDDMRASVERLVDLARLFRRKVIASRIPEIVRTRDAWLEDRTMLETLRADGVDPIYTYLARLFSYGSA